MILCAVQQVAAGAVRRQVARGRCGASDRSSACGAGGGAGSGSAGRQWRCGRCGTARSSSGRRRTRVAVSGGVAQAQASAVLSAGSMAGVKSTSSRKGLFQGETTMENRTRCCRTIVQQVMFQTSSTQAGRTCRAQNASWCSAAGRCAGMQVRQAGAVGRWCRRWWCR